LLDLVDGISRLDLEGDRLAGKGLNEDLHFCVDRNSARKIPRELEKLESIL
jgi:phosphosulfolactate phosphohydrolase-like enzyme